MTAPIAEPRIWLVYSREHNAFWAPAARGYVTDVGSAGRYTQTQADENCRFYGDPMGDGSEPEVAVLAPEAADTLEQAFDMWRSASADVVLLTKAIEANDPKGELLIRVGDLGALINRAVSALSGGGQKHG